MPYRTIVFDLDGTLADTFGCISACADAVLAECDLPPADPSVLRSVVGLSLPRVFDILTEGRQPAGVIEHLITRYRAAFPDLASNTVVLFPGIREQLQLLHSAGIPLAIATSKSQQNTYNLLDILSITQFFQVVVTDDMVTQKKPAPEMLEIVTRKLGATPKKSIMIGDTEFDIHMGKKACFHTCAVTWGNQPREQLLTQLPDHVADSPDELTPALLG